MIDPWAQGANYDSERHCKLGLIKGLVMKTKVVKFVSLALYRIIVPLMKRGDAFQA